MSQVGSFILKVEIKIFLQVNKISYSLLGTQKAYVHHHDKKITSMGIKRVFEVLSREREDLPCVV